MILSNSRKLHFENFSAEEEKQLVTSCFYPFPLMFSNSIGGLFHHLNFCSHILSIWTNPEVSQAVPSRSADETWGGIPGEVMQPGDLINAPPELFSLNWKSLQFQIWRKWQKVIQTGRKHCGKRRNCSLRAISPFPTVFSKGLFSRGVKRCHCVEMG